MATEELELTSTLGLLRWIGWAQMQAGMEFLRERDLSQQQGFTLGFLAQNPGSMQREIAAMSRTTAASVSSLLQGLERRGLIERRTEEGDERSKRVFATEAGATLIEGWDDAMAAVEEKILAPLDPDERIQLQTLLEKVTAILPRPSRD
jgi:DNA-binding MarR family transcriptional regulator